MFMEVHIIFEKRELNFFAKISQGNNCALDIKVVERFIWPKKSMAIRSFN